MLIDTERVALDVFRRDADGHWVLCPYGLDETAELASVALAVSMTVIYEDVSLEAPPSSPHDAEKR